MITVEDRIKQIVLSPMIDTARLYSEGFILGLSESGVVYRLDTQDKKQGTWTELVVSPMRTFNEK